MSEDFQDRENTPQTASMLLVRIDERTKYTALAVETLKQGHDIIGTKLVAIEKDVAGLKPVRTIVFAAVGVVLAAVITAIVALVIHKP